MNTSDMIWVWGENVNPEPPAPPPTVSVSAWPHLFAQQWLKWRPYVDPIPDEMRQAKIAFVNLFHTPDSRHIEEVKRVNPGCYVVAMPDPVLDMVLDHPDWMGMHRQMSMADAIGGRTHSDCRVYGTLLNKPTVYLPSPIGPTDWFKPFRDLPKEDYLLTLDHAFSPKNSYANVAAVAAIQRETGIRVLYAAERDWTPEYAALAGLKAEFLGRVEFRAFVELTAKARICLDMYTSHSFGRQQVLSAMVGTPMIGSAWCEDAPGYKSDPFEPAEAMRSARWLLCNEQDYDTERQYAFEEVESRFGFNASRKRLEEIVSQIEQVKA